MYGSTKQKRSNASVTLSAIFSFICKLYLKQQSNIHQCFCNLKFESILFSNKLFRCIFHSKKTVYTAENDKMKYFIDNQLVKIPYLCVKTTSWDCCYCHKLRFFKLVESFIRHFHHSGNCMLQQICIISWTTTTSD